MARYPQAVLVSCEIPWDENENLMEDLFREEVRHTLKAGFNHLYIFGTAGEGHAVDTARFQQIVQIFYEETRGPDVHPMVGAIGLSTANLVERVGLAHDVGFRTFQTVLPSWGALNDDELANFLQRSVWHVPGFTVLYTTTSRVRSGSLVGEDYRRLIDAVPNLVATKTTSGGLPGAADLMRHSSELQHFFGEWNFPHGCMFGECSLLASFGPMTPHKTWEYFEAGCTRQVEKTV